MGLSFRKSIKIMPGVKINIGKKGVSSVSVGGRGARVNIGKKGTRTTVGLPGSGLSYSNYSSHKPKKPQQETKSLQPDMQYDYQRSMQAPSARYIEKFYTQDYRSVSVLLGFGIFFIPYIFSWLTLRQGYSTKAKVVSFTWMIVVLIILIGK